MATTTKRSVISEVYSALQGIKVDRGYANTIVNASLRIYDWETAQQEGGLPYAGIKPGRVTATHDFGGEIRCQMVIQVVLHMRASTAATAYDEIDTLTDDVLKAVLHDVNRLSPDTNVLYSGHETDVADPDTMDHRGGTVSAVVDFLVTYHRTTNWSA